VKARTEVPKESRRGYVERVSPPHPTRGPGGVVVVVVVEMNIIKVVLSHFCCRTTVQSLSRNMTGAL